MQFQFLTWMQIGVGFTGALTLVFAARAVLRALRLMPTVTAKFSPKGGCGDAVVAELTRARREILMQAHAFTCPQIAAALVAAKNRGVAVTVLLDHAAVAQTAAELKVLAENGLLPHIDDKHPAAHNQVLIIDKKTLLTGSFHFTRPADTDNAENLLVFKGHPELVDQYRQNFLAHQAHSVAPAVPGQAPDNKPKAA